MKYYIVYVFIWSYVILGCQPTNHQDDLLPTEEVVYAKNFKVEVFDTHYVVTVKNVFSDTETNFTYLFYKNERSKPTDIRADVAIKIPISRLIVTSTTHIPPLEMLNQEDKIVGFPQLDYISSEKTRNLINQKKIRDIGVNQQLSIETILDLTPDLLLGFGIDSKSTTYQKLESLGIPICFNADWKEEHPLGKAEWIKFFGIITNQYQKACDVFKEIETNYLDLKNKIPPKANKPMVMSGSDYQGVWYVPQNDNWAVKILEDAQGQYLWQNYAGKGSQTISPEVVLSQLDKADVWIGISYNSIDDLLNNNPSFKDFKLIKQKKLFSSSLKKGSTGGAIFYELATSRPDLVLEDLIQILHPEILPKKPLNFYQKLD